MTAAAHQLHRIITRKHHVSTRLSRSIPILLNAPSLRSISAPPPGFVSVDTLCDGIIVISG